MSSIQTFSRLALKQFCALLEGVAVTESSTGDLESAIWEKIQAGNPGETIRVPYPLIKKSLRKAKLELPYMPGVINYNIGCQALKVTGGLYLPCCGKCEEEGLMGQPNEYCALCTKHGLKYGVMADRGDVGTYSDPTDKHEISFGTWLAKNDKTVEEVQAALLEEGFVLTIPSHYLTVNSKRITKEVKARKGRPKAAKKEVTGDDSDSGSESEEEKPKKAPKKKATKSKSPKSSDGESDEEKPKKEKKAPKKAKSSDGESEEKSEEKPKKKEKKAKSSDEESDGEKPEKKEKKPKKVKEPEAEKEPEPEKKKEKKAKAPKAEKEPEPEKKKEKKSKSPKNSDGESDGEKVEKKEKKSSKSKTEEPKKEKKEKSKSEKPNSTDMSSRFSGESSELGEEEYEEASGFDARLESHGEDAEEISINGTKYMLRGGKHITDIISGEMMGTMDEDGEVHLNGDEDDEF